MPNDPTPVQIALTPCFQKDLRTLPNAIAAFATTATAFGITRCSTTFCMSESFPILANAIRGVALQIMSVTLYPFGKAS